MTITTSSYETLSELTVNNYKVFIFEILDILVVHRLPYDYIKALTITYLLKNYPSIAEKYTFHELYVMRKELECSFRDESKVAASKTQCILSDTLIGMIEMIAGFPGHKMTGDIIDFERSLIVASLQIEKDVVEIVEKIKARGGNIIFSAGIYLGKDYLLRILDGLGLLKYAESVYDASELQNMDIVNSISSMLNINEKSDIPELVYIGNDNFLCETITKTLGIPSIVFTNPAKRRKLFQLEEKPVKKNIDNISIEEVIKAIKVNQFSDEKQDVYSNIAFRFTLPFVSYIHSMIRYCKEHGIEDIFFLSREGLFFKQLFELINKENITGHYLCVSRISLFLLTFKELNDSSIEEIIDFFEKHSIRDDISIAQILYMLKIDNEVSRNIFRSSGVNIDEPIDLAQSRQRIKYLLSDIRIRNLFSKVRDEYADTFYRYMKELDLLDLEKALISDLGWSGSMQSYLKKILHDLKYKVELHGYYFIYDKVSDEKKNQKHKYPNNYKSGYFVYTGCNESEYREKSLVNNLTLELMATAGHGTVISYYETEEKVVPQFVNNKDEIIQFQNFASPIQEKILEISGNFALLFNKLPGIFGHKTILEYNTNGMHDFFTKPDLPVAKLASNLYLFDDFFGKSLKFTFIRFPWWYEAHQLLNIDKTAANRVLRSKKSFHRDFGSGFRKMNDWIRRNPLIAKTTRIKKRLFGKVSNFSYVTKSFGIIKYYKYKLFKIITKSEVFNRELQILNQYIFRKPEICGRNTGKQYIFIIRLQNLNRKNLIQIADQVYKQDYQPREMLTKVKKNFFLIRINGFSQYEIKQVNAECLDSIFIGYDYCITLSPGIILDKAFLCCLETHINKYNEPDMAYCDNDTLVEDLYYTKPKYKHGWSLFSYLEYDYVGRVYAVRVDSIKHNLESFISAFYKNGARDALLTVLGDMKKISNLENILYHERIYSFRNNIHSVNNFLKVNFPGSKAHKINEYRTRIEFGNKNYGKVSVIIPFRDKAEFLKKCVGSLASKTRYENYELVLVNNNSVERETFSYLEELKKQSNVVILDYLNKFNFPAINNYAAELSKGKYLLFLNNDTEIIDGCWINRLLDYAHLDRVGCVGAKLMYPDRRIQHGGIIFNFNDAYPARNQFSFESVLSDGYLNRLKTVQNYSAVAAACMMMRKEVFFQVGKFDESFAVAYNDLDLCCRIITCGYDVIWNPHVKLIHHEYVSRGRPFTSRQDMEERDRFKKKWESIFSEGDKFHNNNLDLDYNLQRC